MNPSTQSTAEARLLLEALRALARSQQISERADTRCCGMTVAQAAAIHVLYLEGPMPAGALSRRLGIAPSTLTRNVEGAEAAGLVTRNPDPADGRVSRLCLTGAGERAATELEARNERFAQDVLGALGESRRDAVEGLIELLRAMDEIAGDCCPEAFRPIREFVRGRSVMREESR